MPTMNFRSLALGLACAAQLAALGTSAEAQGLRPTPQLPGRAAPRDLGPQPADFIVVVVNSEPITNNDVRSRLLRYEQQLTQSGAPVPPRGQLVREVVDRLISEKAQLQLARENGVRVDEGAVDQAEQAVARQNQLEVPELRRRLAADGVNVAQFRADLREQIMLTRLRERELDSRSKVTDLDIDNYLREQETTPDPALAEVNLAHILVAAPENASQVQLLTFNAKAQRLLERARAGEDFQKLARENSDAAGAAQNGGVVGMRPAERLPPLFVETTRNLPVGGVSDVIRTTAGFHIIKVLERRKGGVTGISVTQTR